MSAWHTPACFHRGSFLFDVFPVLCISRYEDKWHLFQKSTQSYEAMGSLTPTINKSQKEMAQKILHRGEVKSQGQIRKYSHLGSRYNREIITSKMEISLTSSCTWTWSQTPELGWGTGKRLRGSWVRAAAQWTPHMTEVVTVCCSRH